VTQGQIRALLVCPICRGQLCFTDLKAICRRCGQDYPVRGEVPVLIAPDSPFHSPPPPRTARGEGRILPPSVRRLLISYVNFNPPLTIWLDRSLFRHLNQCTPGLRILNLGSGVGLFDHILAPHLQPINLDVQTQGRVDVLADAHALPFPDESLDGIFSNAVLEHVQRPWRVAEEIHRVLRPGGKVFINVPFLNVIHDTHDYFRFTDRGLDILFSRFRKIDGGVSGGPSSFLAPFLVEYLLYFVPGQYLKGLVQPLLRLFVWPLKYLDLAIRRNPNLRIAADAFYFVGEK